MRRSQSCRNPGVLRFWRERNGAVVAEYALLAAVIVVGLGVAAYNLSQEVAATVDDASACLVAESDCAS